MTLIVQSSFLKKFSTSLVAGITVVALILMLGNGGNIPWFPAEIVFPMAGIILLLSIIFPIYWQVKENTQNTEYAGRFYTLLYAVTRYCVAFNVASFGWKKILGLQFRVPVEIASQPMNAQSGEWLTWYYFGHSFTFGIIIALLQLSGATFLVFRRTQLLGLFILLGVMLNLTLVNIFYDMNAGALVQSVSITLGLVFLLLLDYKRLMDFFFPKQHISSGENRVWKNLVRLSALVLSFLFSLYLAAL